MRDPLAYAAIIAFAWLWLWLPHTSLPPLLQATIYMGAVAGFICVRLEHDDLLSP